MGVHNHVGVWKKSAWKKDVLGKIDEPIFSEICGTSLFNFSCEKKCLWVKNPWCVVFFVLKNCLVAPRHMELWLALDADFLGLDEEDWAVLSDPLRLCVPCSHSQLRRIQPRTSILSIRVTSNSLWRWKISHRWFMMIYLSRIALFHTWKIAREYNIFPMTRAPCCSICPGHCADVVVVYCDQPYFHWKKNDSQKIGLVEGKILTGNYGFDH